MASAECANGHLYDPEQYASCPYCNGVARQIEFGTTGSSGVGRTMPIRGGFGTGMAPESEIGSTVAPRGYQEKRENVIGKTVSAFQKEMNLMPVVGWLVCIEGPEKGKDFRILAKINTIGRSENMDICMKGDPTISKENQARLAYDEKHNNFHLIPAENMNNIYVNDEPVYVPVKLTPYDFIEFGASKFAFLPFCSKNFTWQGGLKQGE